LSYSAIELTLWTGRVSWKLRIKRPVIVTFKFLWRHSKAKRKAPAYSRAL